ncbi:L-serine ammonia-lyase, iron-sulfur-dependent, subunit alpha [Pseudomonas tolaasii]|uniref:L-serine ammonia-lyase n=4 Tax=Pseudomonas TaxID=286 RepID=A0A7Y8DSK2_PSETO|nr:L-serine ammonia-lyase, iron-sulfur-dependent, subunit alpha [Pseudomonas tolaasii]PKA78612.1 L-serine dehydratase [Pseudomonas tolaasii NCPPB 2192]ARB31316.1 serine ammonia-lyase [Pseudomonas tolaasii]KAB0466573.1 serine ammonia-lyase [Pseudomonas tolaasii]NVZ45467.1 L-serine ammonia-lyase, iron-sulfur-dependent, subunit alpha [Pseudomonas tolaasii]NWA48553.1 L-serine ammonia-lyase, iron-sulfur-dependent, subunit alpha [Pseudomonas tolaasii]
MTQDISLLNTVIGPVMRGPSSSHSAAPYMIGRTVRELALAPGEQLRSVVVHFDPSGSFAEVYSNQGSDEGFAAGLAGVTITSEAYKQALQRVRRGQDFEFAIRIVPLERNDHPNRVDLHVCVTGIQAHERTDVFEGVSLGGGTFLVTHLNGQHINVDGAAYTLIVEHEGAVTSDLMFCLEGSQVAQRRRLHDMTICALTAAPSARMLADLRGQAGLRRVRLASPTQEVVCNRERTLLGASHLLQCVAADADLADYATAYECDRLGLDVATVQQRFDERVQLMAASVEAGLAKEDSAGMKYLRPTARRFSRTPLPEPLESSFLKIAIAGALAAMEETTSRGVVCAAPTAGSAGIVPGCLHALRAFGASYHALSDSLKVMALIGALFAVRGSYAAEMGGCSVETGTSAAMAAAGITHYFGGTPAQILTAASICLMNTLGLICDPVGGEVEIPCHARNIAGVGHAWSASTAALGGFDAVIPFDELVEQTVKVGDMMHPDLRCTARGGCATTPSALRLVAVKNLEA